MSDTLLKQIVFDCAIELMYKSEKLSNEEIAIKLMNAIESHDKANLKKENT